MNREQSWLNLQGRIQINPNLPIADHTETIVKAIQQNQICIVAAETGSGKTTQVPKCCLLAGLGKDKKIILTQPRRIAAVSTSKRLAEECSVELGKEIGYRIRFDHNATDESLLEVNTDGILLSGDLTTSSFDHYDCVILDEIHERSINLDLLMGLLKLTCQRNKNFRLILMSATMDTNILQKYFPQSKLIQIEGRTYPVSINYSENKNEDVPTHLKSILQEVTNNRSSGDILCFLATERDITETNKKLSDHFNGYHVHPLYSRLPKVKQEAVFKNLDQKKIILSTNIAETSITLPNVRTVIDSGQVRLMRFQSGRGIPQLQIESISQASAIQRAGRAGRTGPGICIRMYEESDYKKFEDYTPPEIKRTDLGNVILKLVGMGIANPESFDFLEKPGSKTVRHACEHLVFLRALTKTDFGYEITNLGRDMVKLPLSPRLAHLMLNAKKHHQLLPITILVAFLSIKDPRIEPAEEKQRARDKHRRWQVEGSDLLGYLKLYQQIQKVKSSSSNTAFKKWCHENFLSWLNIREWEQLIHELASTIQPKHDTQLKAIKEDEIHQIILGSHLDHLLQMDTSDTLKTYQSLSRSNIIIHPSSILYLQKPEWGCCISFLNTGRLYSLHCFHIQPEWVIRLAKDLLKFQRGAPWFDEKTEKVVSEEKVFFNQHLLKTNKRKDHFPFDSRTASDIFYDTLFITKEYELQGYENIFSICTQLQAYDAASRIRDVYFNADHIIDVLKKKLGLCSRMSDFKKLDSKSLTFSIEDFLTKSEQETIKNKAPIEWIVNETAYPITYVYDVNSDQDGASIRIPTKALNQIEAHALDLAIPDYFNQRLEKAYQLLPKDFKEHFKKEELIQHWIKSYQKEFHSFERVLEFWLQGHTSRLDIVESYLDSVRKDTPKYLKPILILVNPQGEELDSSRDLPTLLSRNQRFIEKNTNRISKEKREVLSLTKELGDSEQLKTLLRLCFELYHENEHCENGIYKAFHFHKDILYRQSFENEDQALRKNVHTFQTLFYAIFLQTIGEKNFKDYFSQSQLKTVPDDQDYYLKPLLSELFTKFRKQDFVDLHQFKARLTKVSEKNLIKFINRSLSLLSDAHQTHRNLSGVNYHTSYKDLLEKNFYKLCKQDVNLGDLLKNRHLNFAKHQIIFLKELSSWYHNKQERHRADEFISGFLQLQKDILSYHQDPLIKLRDTPLESSHWLEVYFPKDDFKASEKVLNSLNESLTIKKSQLESLKAQLSDAESFIQSCQLECKVSENDSHPSKKETLLRALLDKYKTNQDIICQFDHYTKDVNQLKKDWKSFSKSKKKILKDEKSVNSSDFAEMLGKAWKIK